MNPGEHLKDLRSRLGITLREVEEQSQKIADQLGNPEFMVSNHWLTRLENTDSVPSIYKLFSLSAIYHTGFSELLSLFGVDLEMLSRFSFSSPTQRTHLLRFDDRDSTKRITFPVRFDPGFHAEETSLVSRMVETWGEVPIPLIRQLDLRRGQYGYIGLQDYTMYPLLRPGSFVQIDPTRQKIAKRAWRTEFDRPIYFLELRDGYACCWCEAQGEELLLVPHSLSPAVTRRIDRRSAEIVGRVTAVAMRIVDPVELRPDAALRLGK